MHVMLVASAMACSNHFAVLLHLHMHHHAHALRLQHRQTDYNNTQTTFDFTEANYERVRWRGWCRVQSPLTAPFRHLITAVES